MRISDVGRLAFLALWQRKLRTLLTTVGVAVGSFVLITSLSLGEGVQEVLLGQLRKQDQLRRVLVWPGGHTIPKTKVEEVEVPGMMSEGRRERLREAFRRRFIGPPTGKPPPPGLTSAEVEALTRMEHVEAVTPAFSWSGTVGVGGKRQAVTVRTAAEDDPGVARRRVEGRAFKSGEKGIYLSEYALYNLGVTEEAEVQKALNQDAALSLTLTPPRVGNLLFLLNVTRPNLSPQEQKVLDKVMAQLPFALEKVELSVEERKVLTGLLAQARPEATRDVERRVPIVAVYRDVARAELGPWDGPPTPVDVILSPALAKEMYFAVPGRAQTGLPQVSVRVDHEKNLRHVEKQIKGMGLETFSFADLLDQVRVNVLLIAVVCTLVAIISLIVAALGITNTMLMSVLERTHEIGVMKATGARDGDVQALFLMEGTLVGVLGAVVGLVAAWLVSFPGDQLAKYLVAKQTPMALEESVFLFPGWLMVMAPLGVCVLTTMAATYPAWRAARVDPIAALRR